MTYSHSVNFPAACVVIVSRLGDSGHPGVTPDVLEEVKVLPIITEVLMELCVRHVLRKISWHWEVTESHHFFAGVGDETAEAGCALVRP